MIIRQAKFFATSVPKGFCWRGAARAGVGGVTSKCDTGTIPVCVMGNFVKGGSVAMEEESAGEEGHLRKGNGGDGEKSGGRG